MAPSQIRGIVQLAFSLENKMKKTIKDMDKFITSGKNSLKKNRLLKNPRKNTDGDRANKDASPSSPTLMFIIENETSICQKSSEDPTDLFKAQIDTDRLRTKEPEDLSLIMATT